MEVDPVEAGVTEWEIERPTYRVYFWGRSAAPPEVSPEHVGYYSRQYRLHGAVDVHEVLRWADSAAAAEETYTLYVEGRDAGAPGLILLAGTDPTAAGREPVDLDEADHLVSVADFPELLPVWHAFRDARASRRAVEWLWENDLVTDEAAERFYTNHPDPELP